MITDTLGKIATKIKTTETLNAENKAELLGLVQTLEREVTSLAQTHSENAESITGFTSLSTHEATRENKDDHLLSLAIEGLSSSVKGFETSHPRLVSIVNTICQRLSDLGI